MIGNSLHELCVTHDECVLIGRAATRDVGSDCIHDTTSKCGVGRRISRSTKNSRLPRGPAGAGQVSAHAVNFLKEGDTAVLPMYKDEIVGVELPAAVELVVTETEPGMQGDRVSGARKAATLETGLIVQVPLFVNVGDRVKVDTRSSDYLSRA